jgi:DNA-directed RNA polymerase specialized sigma24 family protein
MSNGDSGSRSNGCGGDARRELETVDWTDIYDRLLRFARRKIGRRADAGNARDYVHDAIAKTLDGKTRPWDPARTTLLAHLYGVVRSEISHPSKGYGHSQAIRTSKVVNFEVEYAQFAMRTASTEIEVTSRFWAGSNTLLSVEREYYNKQIRFRATESLNSYEKGRSYLDLLFSGVDRPREVSKILGVTTKEVDNVRKRSLRYLRKDLKDA